MTESGFWIGMEAMPLSVLRAAAEHERPIFCGRLSLDHTLQAELGDAYERAEWHDVAPVSYTHLTLPTILLV